MIAGCGSSSSSSSSSGAEQQREQRAVKNGGTVTILEAAGGVDSLDPGYWYYQTDYADSPSRRSARCTRSARPTPARARPRHRRCRSLTDGGKTLTIHISSGVHYSPPLASQTVTSADIKYAMERCFCANVGNGYSSLYYSDIVGAPSAPAPKLPNITGIQTPSPTTLVIKTKVPVGVLADANALALPCTVPVPESYAAKYDTGSQSSYGMHQVFTGPYMIQGAGIRHGAQLGLPDRASCWCSCATRAGARRPTRSVRPTSTRSCSRAETTSRSPAARSSAARA